MTKEATYRGWTNKPTPRSETARLRSSVFKGLDNEVFLKASIVIVLSVMAVYDNSTLMAQFAICIPS